MPHRHAISTRFQLRKRNGTVPLGSEFVVILAILFSILFVLSVSLAFVNSEANVVFRDTLDEVALKEPGIVLLGESVDMDVDEPSVTIRWSALGCGTGFILSGSPTLHSSSACGLPAIPLSIFVDNAKDSVFDYDPDSIPTSPATSQRTVVQAQIQFDSDHVLDVHNTRLYPFDTYLVSTSLRATSSNSSMSDIPIPISSLPVLQLTSSFSVRSRDSAIVTMVNGEEEPARHLELRVRRPGDARTYAMLIFGINWILSHFNFGIVILSISQGRQTETYTDSDGFLHRGGKKPKEALKQLAGVLAVLLVIPQLRDAMPDAPGFDGVLIDSIGFFPQMTLAGLSAIVLMLILAKRELDRSEEDHKPSRENIARFSTDQTTLESYGRLGTASPPMHRLVDSSHSRKLSTRAREIMMARVARILEAGSQVFFSGSVGGESSHARSRSQLGRKLHAA